MREKPGGQSSTNKGIDPPSSPCLYMSSLKCLHVGWDFVLVNHNTDGIPGEASSPLRQQAGKSKHGGGGNWMCFAKKAKKEGIYRAAFFYLTLFRQAAVISDRAKLLNLPCWDECE
jgi:hypothetical protein